METNYPNSELNNSEITKLSVEQSNDSDLYQLKSNQDFMSSDCQMKFIKLTKQRHLNINELLKKNFTQNTTNLKTSKDGK
jgi:hypothetical protein